MNMQHRVSSELHEPLDKLSVQIIELLVILVKCLLERRAAEQACFRFQGLAFFILHVRRVVFPNTRCT